MTAFENAQDLIRAERLQGPTDLYRVLLTIKNGFGNGITELGCYAITKAQAKQAGIKWSSVVDMVSILGLKMDNRCGRWGHTISR